MIGIIGNEISIDKYEEKKVDEIEIANREIDIIRKKRLNLKLNRKFFEKMLKRHIKSDRDYIICASSFEGEGKSTLVIKNIGFEIGRCDTTEKKLNFLKNNVVYDPTGGELIRVIKKIKPRSILIVDEAQRLLYKRNYQTSERKELNILFSTIRQKNLIVIFCIPDFYDLDIYFRNWRIKSWLYVPVRGINIVFKKSNSPFSKDKWEQKKNQKMITLIEDSANKGKLLSKTDMILALRKLKSYGLEFTFDDWEDPVVKEAYLKYKEWGSTIPPEEQETIELSESEKDKKVAQALFLKGSTTKEIADIIGKSLSSVRDYVRPVREDLKEKEKKSEDSGSDIKPIVLG